MYDTVRALLKLLIPDLRGSRKAPDGITLTKTGDMEKAIELQQQIAAIGIPEFVRLCAAQDGETIPEEELESFDPSQMLAALSIWKPRRKLQKNPHRRKRPEEPVKSEIRDIYEVFLDSVCLEDNLLSYLIDIAKRGAKDEFQTLSHAAARTLLDLDEFLLWLGNKEVLAGPDERACAAIMDAALTRLMQEKQRAGRGAALRRRDDVQAFPTEAPELVHLPDATYEWYVQNYLDRYYPVRFIMKMNGVEFPDIETKEA